MRSLPKLCGVLAGLLALSLLAQTGERRLPPLPQSAGSSSRRIALAIGNNLYPGIPLRNAVNDSRSVAAVLREIGFSVSQFENLARADSERAIRRFTSQISPGDTAFFYYSGHGIQIENVNYVVPVDFQADDEISAKERGLSIEMIRERMEAAKPALSILVIDACRDNPFKTTRSGMTGLAAMEGGQGTLIVLATGPGKTASDNPGESNGLFTKYLVEALRKRGVKATQVFDEVKARVFSASGGRQRPWIFSDVIGDFYLAAPPSPMAQVTLVPPSELFEQRPAPTASSAIWEALQPGSKKEMPEPSAAAGLPTRDWAGKQPVYSVLLDSYQDRGLASVATIEWKSRSPEPVFVASSEPGALGVRHCVLTGRFQTFSEALALFRKLRQSGVKGLAMIYRVSDPG